MILSTVLTSPIFVSATVVALAEIGDKTMLLAILLVTRMRKPWAILAGIFVATVANHLIASLVGVEISGLLDARWFRILVAVSFIAMAAWTLVPDKLDDDSMAVKSHGGAFLTTVIAFFLVEIGDKTQIATIALAAHYHSILDVATGTTLGMMLADGPAVFLGAALVRRVSLKAARLGAAALFLGLGLWQLYAVLTSA
jgi:putative Ca2+/H+ antiporter (TMEM165/GDT1 family)